MSERNDAIEAAAQIVDQCNRERPYNAIGAASRIRALKRASPVTDDVAEVLAELDHDTSRPSREKFARAAAIIRALAAERDAIRAERDAATTALAPLDAVVHVLGIEDSEDDPAETIQCIIGERDILRDEREGLQKNLDAAREVLRTYEKWEADLILCSEAWSNGLPQMTQKLYDRWIAIQEQRNHALPAAPAAPAPALPSEEEIAQLIEAARAEFHRDGPAKARDERWTLKAARAVLALIGGKK